MSLRYWSRRWRRDSWIRALSGTTCASSTLDHGVVQWISSLRDSPASPSPSPASDSANPTTAGSGPTSPASSPSADQRLSSSRTSNSLLFDDPDLTWKIWASESSRRSASLRQTLALRTSATAGGCWQLPTPTARDWRSGGHPSDLARRTPCLNTAVLLPTPTVIAAKRPFPTKTKGGRDLETEVAKLLPTPTASLGTHAGRVTQAKAREGGTLVEAMSARLLPTPTINGNYNKHGLSERSGDGLQTAVGGRLNPVFVEAMMMLPIGWTACACSATAWSHWLRLSRSMFCWLRR